MTYTRFINFNQSIFIFGIPLLMIGGLIWLMQSSSLMALDHLDWAITADLVLTVPLVYIFLIRKTDIPKTTVLPLILLGLAVGTYFLPSNNQYYLSAFKTWALPVIEITVFAFITCKVRSTIRRFKKLNEAEPDFYSSLKQTCNEVLPRRLASMMASELAVLYFGFVNWKSRSLGENEFSYHKESGTPALFGALVFIIGVETIALHVLIAQWSEIVANIMSLLSLYTAVQVFGFARSLAQRPITIQSKSLSLKYGILSEVEILFSNIKEVELSGKDLIKNPLTKKLSPIGDLEAHNIIIHLKEEQEMVAVYGIRRKFRTLGLHVDNYKEFKQKLDQALLST